MVKPQFSTMKEEIRFHYFGSGLKKQDNDESCEISDEHLDEVALLMQDPTYRPGFEDIKRLYKSVKSDSQALINQFSNLKSVPIYAPMKFTVNYLAKRQESHLQRLGLVGKKAVPKSTSIKLWRMKVDRING